MTEKSVDSDSYHITARTDRILIPAGQSCQRYLHLILTAPVAPGSTERHALNLSLILDRSGSMSGNKLAFVKQAAEHALRMLNERDRASIVIYDGAIQVLAASQSMSPVNRERMIQAIQGVRTGGMTNLSGGWFTGCDQIADHQRADAINRALLLTDGLANQGITDQEELASHAKALHQRGVTTTTFGVGNDFNEFLLQAIGDAGGGHFYFIEDPDQIPNYFNGELGEMLETSTREATLSLNTPTGTTLRLINDIPHEVTDGGLRVFLGDTYSGQTHELILRLDLPARPQGQALDVVPRVDYHDVTTRALASAVESLVYTVASPSQVAEQAVDEEVLSIAARLEVEGAKLRAMKLERAGQRDQAKTLLRGTAQVVAAFAAAPAAQAVQAELADLEEELEQGLTKARRKAVTYTAYRTHRSRRDYKKK